jgi:hypothetical protein
LIETQRRRRGHQFWPTKAVTDKIPALYGTESTSSEDKIVYAHYFSAGGDWWLTELDQESGEAYGYTKLAQFPEGAEWGYVDLHELEQVNAHHGLVIVERDMDWTPTPFSQIAGAQR